MASPVVIVPKKSAPGEPLRHRMCIDFGAVNDLQATVVKADSKEERKPDTPSSTKH